MRNQTLTIKGMTCSHCVNALKQELEQINALEVKHVEIGRAEIIYDEKLVTEEMIEEAVDEAGYEWTKE